MLAFATTSFAQKYGEDSVKCVQNLSLYRDYYKQKMYDDAYNYWNIVFKICPASSERMYVDGVNLMRYKIKKAKGDAALKKAYIDTLWMVYDQRKANFGKEGYVDGRKATDMLRYINDQPEVIFPVIESSIKERGLKSEAGAVVTYMNTLVLLEKAGKKTASDIVEAYGTAGQILGHNISKYKGKKSEEYYLKAEESVNQVASPYLSCEILIKMATDNYESKKDDLGWKERTADILDKKGCTDDPIFFTLAKDLHTNSPSALSAEKMGIMSLKNKKYNDAVEFFKQALEMNEDQSKEYDYHIELAQAYSSIKSYGAARAEARKASQLKPNEGLPYIMIGDMVASTTGCGDDACKQKAVYWLATDYYIKAKSIDGSVAAKANAKIASYKKYYPTKEDCFFGGTKEGDSVELGCWIGESTKARF